MIVLIDLGISNLNSIICAFDRIGLSVNITSNIDQIKQADLIILPGAGAFGDGITSLNEKGLVSILQDQVIAKEKHILGICLGFQLLFQQSEEHGVNQGLGLLEGKIVRLESNRKEYSVPNVGWCDLNICKQQVMFKHIRNGEPFYFSHSYYVQSDNPKYKAATINYSGQEITVATEYKNIYGIQFHPEKSQDAGLNLLSNIVGYIEGRHSWSDHG
jgi:glutamine amidotransferase